MLRRSAVAQLVVAMVILLSYSLGLAQSEPQAQVPARISAPIDPSSRMPIAGSMHQMAQPQFDRGPVAPNLSMERMFLVLGASPEQEHELSTLLDRQQTKGSADYHRWLTPQEFGQKFGPSVDDIQQVTRWLQQEGFKVGSVAKSGRWIEFSGTAAQVQAAFATSIRQYEIAGKRHIANAAEISIPAALWPVVRGVGSLHNFFTKPMNQLHGSVRQAADGSLVQVNPDGTFQGGVHALSPGDFANIYDLNPLYTAGRNGSGQIIAIVARSDIDANDIAAFQSKFNLPTNPANVILNGPDPGVVPGDDIEATLDTEWSSGVAPGATIDVVISASTVTTDGVDLSAAYIVDNNLAPVMSVSFGQCEALLGGPENAFWNSLWQQASAQGISVFVASGDDGAAGCDDPTSATATHGLAVSGLASTPFNTAVGGTEFNETVNGGTDATFWNSTNGAGFVSAKGYIPEMVWNESCNTTTCGSNANLFAGSGGQSSIYFPPPWQSLNIPGLAGFTHRVLPDVSLTAAGHDGYLICFQLSCPGGTFVLVGGTSASSPAFAGIMAIIDQKLGARQGLPNYVLYPLASAEDFSNCNSSNRGDPAVGTTCFFNDTTAGNNNVPGQIGFNAGIGFDLATGLGSVDATNLAAAWSGINFLGTTTTLVAQPPQNPITLIHGQSVSFNVSVTRQGNTGSPTGNVSLIASGGTLAAPVGVAATSLVAGGPTATASFSSITNLPGGATYNLIAHYPGDGNFASSDSGALTVTVTPESSTTSLTSIIGFDSQGHPILGASISYGGFLDLRTVVTSSINTSPPDGFPSGTITINDNGAPIQAQKLNNFAQAEFFNCGTQSAPCLTVGSHPIQVVYGGDSSFSGSATTNPAVTITVTKATPSLLVSAPTGVSYNQQFAVGVQIPPAGPIHASGTVQFFQGSTAVGSPATLDANSIGAALITLTGTGNTTLSAQYSGDGTYNPATAGPFTITIGPPFSLGAAVNGGTTQTIAAGQTATYNLVLAAIGGFTGSVNLTCAGAPGPSTCAINPSTLTLTSTAQSLPFTVTVSNTANARLAPVGFRSLPIVFAAVLAGLLWSARRKPRQALLVILLTGIVAGIGSCGGGGGSSPPPTPTPTPKPPPTVATLTVTGTSGSATNKVTLNLTITH